MTTVGKFILKNEKNISVFLMVVMFLLGGLQVSISVIWSLVLVALLLQCILYFQYERSERRGFLKRKLGGMAVALLAVAYIAVDHFIL